MIWTKSMQELSWKKRLVTFHFNKEFIYLWIDITSTALRKLYQYLNVFFNLPNHFIHNTKWLLMERCLFIFEHVYCCLSHGLLDWFLLRKKCTYDWYTNDISIQTNSYRLCLHLCRKLIDSLLLILMCVTCFVHHSHSK